MIFTNDEVETLKKALDAYETAESRDNMMGDMMSTLLLGALGKKDDPDFEKFKTEQEKEREKKRQEIEQRKSVLSEKIIMLKAKLITLKDKNIVEDAIKGSAV